jgi:hypothetical protein
MNLTHKCRRVPKKNDISRSIAGAPQGSTEAKSSDLESRRNVRKAAKTVVSPAGFENAQKIT